MYAYIYIVLCSSYAPQDLTSFIILPVSNINVNFISIGWQVLRDNIFFYNNIILL